MKSAFLVAVAVTFAIQACGGSEQTGGPGAGGTGGGAGGSSASAGKGGDGGRNLGTGGSGVSTTTSGISCGGSSGSATGGAGGSQVDASACPELVTCSGDASMCPPTSQMHVCGGQDDKQCCVPNPLGSPVCVECNCDGQCPSATPFCVQQTCVSCRSACDCPAGQQCFGIGNDGHWNASCR